MLKCEERIASYRCAVPAMTGYRNRIRFTQMRGTRNDGSQNMNPLPGELALSKAKIPGTLQIRGETKPTMCRQVGSSY